MIEKYRLTTAGLCDIITISKQFQGDKNERKNS